MSDVHKITVVENKEGRGLHTCTVFIQEHLTDIFGPSVRERFQAAYEEYIHSLGYETLEKAFFKKGIHFESRFYEIPSEILEKHGLKYYNIKEHFADAIYGFGSEINEKNIGRKIKRKRK